ncbi:MAG: DUF3891 family protein [Ginsengibacter sp.]
MIVNYTKNGWKVITQRAHGILAAQLAAEWKISERPQRWLETLLAIAEHDDAEVELDGENLLSVSGGPLNFNMKEFDPAHYEKLSLLTITKNRYIALLTSLHMEFLSHTVAETNAKAKEFLKDQAIIREKWMKELNLTEKEVLRIYDLLEWCDACSLLLCQDLVQPEKRKLEISTGPDKKLYYLIQVGDKQLTVTPWPFESKKFTVSFEWRTIKQLQFSSSNEFRKAFLKARVKETTWEMIHKPVPDKRKKV